MRTDRSVLTWLCGSGLALGLLSGCPGKLSNKERFVAYAAAAEEAGGTPAVPNETGAEAGAGAELGPCGDVPQRIFVPSCGGTGCHGAMAAQQGLDLVSEGVASRVVGISGKVCASTLADPKDPEHSLMYEKLSPTPPCGAPMPLARPPLSSADVACVLAWIAAQ